MTALVLIVGWVVYALLLRRIAVRVGHHDPKMALIPLVGLFVLPQITKTSPLWVLALLFVPYPLGAGILGYWGVLLAKRFGYNPAIGMLMAIPIANIPLLYSFGTSK